MGTFKDDTGDHADSICIHRRDRLRHSNSKVSFRLQLSLRRHNLIQKSYTVEVKLENSKTDDNTHALHTVNSHVALAAPHIPHNIPEAPLNLPLTRCDLLLVVLRYDIFPCVGVIQHTLCVWEPAHETPVEQTGSEKGVDVPDCETAFVLASCIWKRRCTSTHRCLPPSAM
jgi:hypothetical protein